MDIPHPSKLVSDCTPCFQIAVAPKFIALLRRFNQLIVERRQLHLPLHAHCASRATATTRSVRAEANTAVLLIPLARSGKFLIYKYPDPSIKNPSIKKVSVCLFSTVNMYNRCSNTQVDTTQQSAVLLRQEVS